MVRQFLPVSCPCKKAETLSAEDAYVPLLRVCFELWWPLGTIFSQSVQDQVLAPPMPSRPPESAGFVCNAKRPPLIFLTPTSQGSILKASHITVNQPIVSLSKSFQCLSIFNQWCNSSMWQSSRSEDISPEISLFQTVWMDIWNKLQSIFHCSKKGLDCFPICCGAGRWILY